MLVVKISNAKNMEEMKFHIDFPIIKYCQSTSNSCFFSSLASGVESINQIKDDNSILKCIK